MFPYLEICYLERDISKRKMCHLESNGWNNKIFNVEDFERSNFAIEEEEDNSCILRTINLQIN